MNMIESLEARIAPAAIVTFHDSDGDLVTIKSSIGTVAELTAAAGDLADHQLQTFDLTGTSDFDDATISIIATPQAGKGDGLVNVGYIKASGRVLGAVTVDGDLGVIDAGNIAVNTFALQALTVHSLGVLGTSTGAPADLSSDLAGSVKSITIKGDQRDAFLSITGSTGSGADLKYSSLGAYTIGGSLLGNSGAGRGAVNVDGDIGPVKIGGSVIGGSTATTGQILAINGSIASVSIGGDLIGGASGFSGYIFGRVNIGPVTIGGDVRGGGGASGGNSGFISTATGNIGDVKVGGSLLGGVNVYCGTIAANTNGGAGTLGAVTIGGSVIGGPAQFAGAVYASGDIKSATVGHSLIGSPGLDTGEITSGGSMGAVKIGGDVIGAGGDRSGRIFAQNDLGAVSIRGSLRGSGGVDSGEVAVGPLVVGEAHHIGAVTIGGDVIGGSADYSGTLRGMGTLANEHDFFGPVKIAGDLRGGGGENSGTIHGATLASLSIGGSLIGGTKRIAGSLLIATNSLSIGGDVIGGSDYAAGYISIETPKNITIGGSLIGGSASSTGEIYTVAAGKISIGHDIRGGDAGNSDVSGTGHITGSIASLTIGGSIIAGHKNGSGQLTNSGAVETAYKFGKVTVKGSLVGNATVPVLIVARGVSSTTDITQPDVAIGSLTIGGRVEHAFIGAGSIGQTGVNPDAQIGAVKVGGDWIASNLLAGVDLIDGRAGDGNDAKPAFADSPRQFSRIASITIAGQVLGAVGDPSQVFGFGAEEIGSFKVNGIAIPLQKGRNNDKFAGTGQAGQAIAVGSSLASVVSDGFAVHIFEV